MKSDDDTRRSPSRLRFGVMPIEVAGRPDATDTDKLTYFALYLRAWNGKEYLSWIDDDLPTMAGWVSEALGCRPALNVDGLRERLYRLTKLRWILRARIEGRGRNYWRTHLLVRHLGLAENVNSVVQGNVCPVPAVAQTSTVHVHGHARGLANAPNERGATPQSAGVDCGVLPQSNASFVVVDLNLQDLESEELEKQQQHNGLDLQNDCGKAPQSKNESGKLPQSSMCTERASDSSALERVFGLLDRMPIAEPNRSRIARLSHMGESYLLPWAHYSEDNPNLGGGYFVLRFDARELAPAKYRLDARGREQKHLDDWRRLAREAIEEVDREEQMARDTESAAEPVAVESSEPESEAALEPRYCERHADGDLRAVDIWHAAVNELQLAMTKATFDTWVRPTFAMGWDGAVFVVGVHSPYAIEWLENRLRTTIQRTLTGIIGRAAEVRYVVKDKLPRIAATARSESMP